MTYRLRLETTYQKSMEFCQRHMLTEYVEQNSERVSLFVSSMRDVLDLQQILHKVKIRYALSERTTPPSGMNELAPAAKNYENHIEAMYTVQLRQLVEQHAEHLLPALLIGMASFRTPETRKLEEIVHRYLSEDADWTSFALKDAS